MARKMKPSGVSWCADVPDNWTVRRVKEICTYMSGDTPDTGKNEFYTDLAHGYPWMTIRDLGPKIVTESKHHVSDLGVVSKKMIRQLPGTLMMSFKLSVGITSIAGVECYTNEAIASFKGLYTPYWYYALGTLVSKNAKENIYGAPLLNRALILNAPVLVPPQNEQIAIAAYLDDRTKAIDGKIQLLEEKSTALVELRKSVIHQAVTKGLDPNVAMKPSGVDWIGDIPSHWMLRRNKQIFRKHKILDATIPAGSLSYGEVVYKDEGLLTVETKSSYQAVRKGQFLLNPINLNFDLVSLRIGLSDIDVCVSPAYMCLTNINGKADYFKYALRMFDILHMKTLGAGVRQTLRYDDFANSFMVSPSDKEQIVIAAYLDQRTTAIDESIKTITEQIVALKDLRQSLIYEAVTGKIDVADYGYVTV